jgi:hypothetical protein
MGFVAMADHEIKVAGLQQVVFDAGKNQSRVAFADLRDKNTDRKSLLLAQRTGDKIRAVIEFLCGRKNAVRVFSGNRADLGVAFNTMETAAGDSFRYLARLVIVTGCEPFFSADGPLDRGVIDVEFLALGQIRG